MQQSHIVSRTQGFTIIEMIIVVGVMAILAGLSAPPLISFMQQKDIRNEENTLTEIRKAMTSYLEERKTLPVDTIAATDAGGWASEFARYTNMSPDQISTDTWSRPRAYRMFQASEFVLGSSMPIFYVTLHSSGANRTAEASTSIPIVAGTNGLDDFQASTNTTWWSMRPAAGANSAQTERINAFSDLESGGDDIMIKMTDYPQKIEAYKTTLDRLTRIGESLDSYSKAAYAEQATACLAVPCATPAEQQVYFPQSLVPSGSPADTNVYGTRITTDLTTYNAGASIDSRPTTLDVVRRAQMISLMRILGLPDEYCCSALQSIPGSVDPLTGKPQDMPFYYFSNPRARTSASACSGTRPAATDRKLPARLGTQYINEGVTTPQQTPTCG